MRATPEFKAFCAKWFPILRERASQIVETGEQHVPLLLAWITPNDFIPIGIPEMEGQSDKDAVARLQRKVSETMPTCFITEAWAVKMSDSPRKDADNLLNEHGGTLANHPDREETIVFSFMQDKMQMVAMCFIDRSKGTLGTAELVDPVEEGNTGRFINNEREGRLQ